MPRRKQCRVSKDAKIPPIWKGSNLEDCKKSIKFASLISLIVAVLFSTFCSAGLAENLVQGNVLNGLAPVQGAMVTAKSEKTSIEVTTFSDSLGSFEISGLQEGAYGITVKSVGKVASGHLDIGPNDSFKELSLSLQDVEDSTSSVPSAAWLDLLPESKMKREFILNCASCHGISKDRIFIGENPRTSEQWLAAIKMMRGIDVYGLTPPDFDDELYAKWLSEHFSLSAMKTLKPFGNARGRALRARITEYPVPVSPCLPHDLVVGPEGRIWITAFYHDVVWALNPENGQYESFLVNEDEGVMGQVRALTFGPDEMLWVLLGGTESLVRLNPRDGSFKSFPLGMYPHSIEVDSKGKLWFNDYLSASKRFGSLNPLSGELEIFEVPGKFLAPKEGLPLLYGLEIDQKDVVWGTMLAANRLFRFDRSSKEISVFEMPEENTGPRRPGIGPDGSIWIPEFNTGTATRFDPTTEKFTRYSLGLSSLGLYDIAVDQRSGDVWAGSSLGSSLIRLDPATGAKDIYPFPTEPAYPRHIAIDPKNGDVWTTYSSMPDAVPKIVRIELGEE